MEFNALILCIFTAVVSEKVWNTYIAVIFVDTSEEQIWHYTKLGLTTYKILSTSMESTHVQR